jgi:AcrR family transcriptional regulator
MFKTAMGILGDSTHDVALGLRERQKKDKLLRIKEAARVTFLTKGFEGATVREIANLADVSHATVFSYVKDKRDLLFLVFNEDIDMVVIEAQQTISVGRPLLKQLAYWFTPFYRYFSKEPQMGLLGLHERSIVANSDPISPQIVIVRRRAEFCMRSIEGMIESAKKTGEVSAHVDAGIATRVITAVYFYEMERWLRESTTPDLSVGIDNLQVVLNVIISGLQR